MGDVAKSKEELIGMLRDVFTRWEAHIASLSDEEITLPESSSGLSLKDVMAHLWAWQQRSVARNEAALQGKEPDYTGWPRELGPDPDEDVDRTNAWIHETNRDKPWHAVYSDWREQFLRFLQLSEEIPEEDFVDPARYAWMGGYPLSASLLGSYEHHEEHFEQQLAG